MAVSNPSRQGKRVLDGKRCRWGSPCPFLLRSPSHTTGMSLLFPCLLLLLGTKSRVQGYVVASPDMEVSSHLEGRGPVEEQGRGQVSAVGHQDEDNHCRHYDQQVEPQILYAEELFARMLSTDESTSSTAVVRESWERITATCSLDMPIQSHTVTFNISWLSDSSNITMAQVLVVTNSTSGKNGCQPQLKMSRDHRELPCENKPFKIRNLAAVDVTSLLTQQLGQSQFNIYVKRARHVVAAVLVIFNDISPQQLLDDTELKRCRFSATSIPSATAIDMCSRRTGVRASQSANRTSSEQPEDKESEGAAEAESSQEPSEKREFQPARRRRAARHSNMEGSSQPRTFQTPAHLHRYLSERRKRDVAVNHSEELESVTRAPGSCQPEGFRVFPELDLGLAEIISPSYLEIGKCAGQCPTIVSPSSRVPTYIYIVSLLYTFNPGAAWPVSRPCCQPTRFQSFSVMRIVGDALVIERWNDARVIECACL